MKKDNKGIRKYLRPEIENWNITILSTITSTNALVREKANAGEVEGCVILSDEQKVRRGRKGPFKYNTRRTNMGIERTKNMVLCSVFIALIVVGTFIRIPIPVVPFTLQLLFTMLAGLLLGGKLGTTSVCIYIVMGLLGLPVFAEGGGIGYILKPSFGYIIGFAVASYITGVIANKVFNPSYKRLFAANFIGLGIVYLFGMLYYYLMSNFYLGNPIGLWPLFLYCFILAVPGDIVLCILGAFLGKRMIPMMRNSRM